MSALDYFLKANLYGLLFMGCYGLLLRRHTFFALNRVYLLASAVLSLTLPLASLSSETVQALPVPAGVITLPAIAVEAAPVETGPDWVLIGGWAYGLVAAVLLLQVLVRVRGLLRLVHRSPRQACDDYVLVQPDEPTVPTFSFFRYLVLNPADVNNPLIMRHERVHIRQKHSVDVLGLAVLRAIFWACPVLWLIERALRHVHEFLADRAASVVSQPSRYARFLVEYTFGVRPDPVSNGFFNPSLLKQRIQMLHQRATTRWALAKYALVLPLGFSLLAMTTAPETIRAVVEQATDDTVTVSGRVTSAVDGKPLPGVNVVILNSNRGTTTDSKGHFTINNVAKTDVLVFSFVGFSTQQIPVGNHTAISVSLAPVNTSLSEVIIAPYEPTVTAKPASDATHPPGDSSQAGEVFTVVEQAPEYPGGIEALGQYLSKNLRYPIEAQTNKVQGRVFVQFVVTATGAIQQLRVLKGIGSGCDEEAVRVVAQMPRWKPGKQNGIPVAVQYNLPINFSLEKPADKRTGQYEPVHKPTGSPIGDFPTTRAKDFPHQPRLNTVTIRGTGPLGPLGEGPLYIVDGAETPADSVKAINPNEIESLNVFREGSAPATYGEKGKNGVVVITTKKP